jgi:hypothetical protein
MSVQNKVNPLNEENTVEFSNNSSKIIKFKHVIDLIIEKGDNYKNKNRTVTKVYFSFCCLPCILYSTTVRILSCPFQCIFNNQTRCNPLAACLIGSCITDNSDVCLCATLDTIDEKHKIGYKDMLTREEKIEILNYISEKISTIQDVKIQYALCDYVSNLMICRNLTPDAIINKKYHII